SRTQRVSSATRASAAPSSARGSSAAARSAPSSGAAWTIAVAILLLGLGHVVFMRVMYDDAFISYRYAANLAHGFGPVFNPGERVEGYSNFLWVVMMALLIRLGGEPERIGPLVSAGFALATLALVMFAAQRRGAS